MPNTYTQIYIQTVFTVQNKISLIMPQWQAGFGGFSYSISQIDAVVKYINNQKTHHQKKTFIQEYLEFLEKFKVSYDERYIFKPVEY